MSKRIPLSRASKEFYELLPTVRVSSEAELADSQASVAETNTLRKLMDRLPDGMIANPFVGFDDQANASEYIWLARWAACKQVYRIDSAVAETLKNQPVEGTLPSQALEQLPYPIVYVDCPVGFSEGDLQEARIDQAAGFLAYVDKNPETKAAELTLVYLHRQPDANGKRRHLVSIDLTFSTLDEALDAIVDEDDEYIDKVALGERFEAVAVEAAKERENFKLTVAQAVNLLLYVVAQENDAEVVYEPPRGTQHGQKAGKRTNPETITELGGRIGRRIGEARKAFPAGRLASAGPGARTVAPHIRRAHWQTYWVGPRKGRADGRKGDKVVVKWIPPIEVNGGGAGDEVVHEG